MIWVCPKCLGMDRVRADIRSIPRSIEYGSWGVFSFNIPSVQIQSRTSYTDLHRVWTNPVIPKCMDQHVSCG